METRMTRLRFILSMFLIGLLCGALVSFARVVSADGSFTVNGSTGGYLNLREGSFYLTWNGIGSNIDGFGWRPGSMAGGTGPSGCNWNLPDYSSKTVTGWDYAAFISSYPTATSVNFYLIKDPCGEWIAGPTFINSSTSVVQWVYPPSGYSTIHPLNAGEVAWDYSVSTNTNAFLIGKWVNGPDGELVSASSSIDIEPLSIWGTRAGRAEKMVYYDEYTTHGATSFELWVKPVYIPQFPPGDRCTSSGSLVSLTCSGVTYEWESTGEEDWAFVSLSEGATYTPPSARWPVETGTSVAGIVTAACGDQSVLGVFDVAYISCAAWEWGKHLLSVAFVPNMARVARVASFDEKYPFVYAYQFAVAVDAMDFSATTVYPSFTIHEATFGDWKVIDFGEAVTFMGSWHAIFYAWCEWLIWLSFAGMVWLIGAKLFA